MVKQALEMNINEIAKRQLRDYRNINPGTCFSTDNFDLSINEAYAVQEAVVELRSQEGETVIGYKRTSEEILTAVRDGLADLGIFSGMVEEPELEVLTYRLDTLVVVMGKEHPYRPDHPVKFAEFAKLDMVGLQSGSSLQAFLEVCAGEQGLTLKTRVETLSFDGVRRMVEAGLGIAVLPLGAVEPYLESAQLRMQEIDEDWAVRTLKLAVKDLSAVSNAVRALVEHLIAQNLTDK